jgi:hypothetical protein
MMVKPQIKGNYGGSATGLASVSLVSKDFKLGKSSIYITSMHDDKHKFDCSYCNGERIGNNLTSLAKSDPDAQKTKLSTYRVGFISNKLRAQDL